VSEGDPQLDLPMEFTRRAARISKRASKKRRLHLPVIQQQLIADRTFSPLPGVPASRDVCRNGPRPCRFIRCRFHLWRIDDSDRAGRPGIRNVPRGEHGWTLPVEGDVPGESAGTTLSARWLKVRGLEIERECKVWIHARDGALELWEARTGTLDYWLAHVRPGEPVLVFDDDTTELVAKAELTQDGQLKLDRELPEALFMAVLTRARQTESCALDLIERGQAMTNEQVGDALGRHRTLVARIVREGLGKAIAAAEEMGIERGDFMRALMGDGK
jgi:hypothetical protein